MFFRFAIGFLMLRLSLGAATPGLKTVDFKNFEYPWYSSGARSAWHWMNGTPHSHIRLKDGRHIFDPNDSSHSAYLELSSVIRGDLDGDGQDEAAVDLRYGSGGTASWHYLYVFKASGRYAVPLGVLESGSRAYGGLINIQITQGLLVLDFADADRREGDCCSRGFIRVRYRFKDGRFIETGQREKDSLRAPYYPLSPRTGPQTVRARLDGREVNIVYTDAGGLEHDLTSSGVNTEPNLSSDKRSVVFLREVGDRQNEIWSVSTDGLGTNLLYRGPVRWKTRVCPPSSIRSPQWSIDAHAVFFVTDCSPTTGALWRLDISSGTIKPFIPEAVVYGVIQADQFKGYLIANQRSLPTPDDPAKPHYPRYLYFLYKPDGERVEQVGEEEDDLEELLKQWGGR
jgi:hypothetical protein